MKHLDNIKKKIKLKFKKREKMFGGWISFNEPNIAELFSSINFDFIAIDMEHTTISNSDAKSIIVSCNSMNKPCFPRPVSFDKNYLKPLLDAGCDGIIASTVNSNNDVSTFIDNMKYPNKGKRSFGVNRAQLYGLNEKEYFSNWNNLSTSIIQIETSEAVNNLIEILENQEIDGVMVGPYDLAGSLGVPGDTDHKLVQEAVKYIVSICKKKKISCGTQLAKFDRNMIKNKFSLGFNFLILGSDLFALKNWAIDCNNLINKIK